MAEEAKPVGVGLGVVEAGLGKTPLDEGGDNAGALSRTEIFGWGLAELTSGKSWL